ncbi:MAG: hypothetical protein HWE14_07020 [Flavobacteriia bacterium]|nr:hypothetical protein [Flavobacteriia bacterium]
MKRAYSALILAFALLTSVLHAQTEDWVTLTSEELGYSVEFPQEPEPSERTVASAVGELTLNIHMYDASISGIPDNNLIYMTNVTDYPGEPFDKRSEADRDGVFDGAINGAVTNINGSLVSEEEIELQGVEGRSVKISIYEGQAFVYMRLFLKGNSLYLLQVITLGENDGNDELDAFMSSFKFIHVKSKN